MSRVKFLDIPPFSKYFRWDNKYPWDELDFASDRMLDSMFVGQTVKARTGWFKWEICTVVAVDRLDCGIFNITVEWEDGEVTQEPSFRFFSYLKGVDE